LHCFEKARYPISAVIIWAVLFLLPSQAFAIQYHDSSEGIIVHQIGHLFFLASMVVLLFTVRGKALARKKGWRCIQYAALLFIFWNLNTLAGHFLDNQIHIVDMTPISFLQVEIASKSNSSLLNWGYYLLKLDHLLCVPAMYFLYKGVSLLVENQQPETDQQP